MKSITVLDTEDYKSYNDNESDEAGSPGLARNVGVYAVIKGQIDNIWEQYATNKDDVYLNGQ